MHRSGTSFAARALDSLGVAFGNADLLMQPGPDNPAGYWENRLIKELDNDLLAHLGGSWDSPPVLAPGWESDRSLEEFRVRAQEVLTETFGERGNQPLIGWKDPRLSLLLPFWRTVAPIAATVILVRDPIEVARSLWKRDGIAAPQACLLWLRYLLAAIANDPDGHLIVQYGAFFEDPEGTLRSLARHLSLPEPTDEAIETVKAQLDPGLRHHTAGERDSLDDNPIVTLARSVWDRGNISTGVLGSTTQAIAEGWLRPPVDTEAFDRVRARNVDLTELLRRRSRQRIEAEADQPDRPPSTTEA